MSFLVYKTSKKSGKTECERLKTVSLAGFKSGLIYRTLVRRKEFTEKWHITEAHMLQTTKCDAARHVLIVDLKPQGQTATHLYRIRDIWGYSDAHWTNMLLKLDCVFWHESDDLAAQKDKFPLLDGGVAYEFLYLNRGIKDGIRRGTWNFPKGTVTGPLLFEGNVLDFLQKRQREVPHKEEIDQ